MALMPTVTTIRAFFFSTRLGIIALKLEGGIEEGQ